MPKVLVIIVNYSTGRLTLNGVRSLMPAREKLPDLTVHVVENDSGDGELLTSELSKPEFEDWVKLTLAPRNGGFAYGNNVALRMALSQESPPDYFFLLNPDAEVRSGAVESLVAFLEANPHVGIAGAGLEDADGTPWKWAFRFPNVYAEFDNGLRLGIVSKLLRSRVVGQQMGNQPERVDWLPGAAMLVKREVFEKVGLMDERYFLYFEETDFFLAASRLGIECWYYPDAHVMHLSGQSTGLTTPGVKARRLPQYWFESRRRYFLKNFGLRYAIAADSAYIAGTALCRLRMSLQRREGSEVPHLLTDLIRNFSLLPGNRQLLPERNK